MFSCVAFRPSVFRPIVDRSRKCPPSFRSACSKHRGCAKDIRDELWSTPSPWELAALSEQQLLEVASAQGVGVTVLRRGQLGLRVGDPVSELEARIAEAGGQKYVEEFLRERSQGADEYLRAANLM